MATPPFALPAPLTLQILPEKAPVARYIDKLAVSAKAAAQSILRAIAACVSGDVAWVNPKVDLDTFPWEQLRESHIDSLVLEFKGKYKPRTILRALAAIRAVAFNARKKMPGTDYTDLVAAVKEAAKRVPRPSVNSRARALTAAEVTQLIKACGPQPRDRRDAAMIAVMYGAGLRRIEVVRLQVSDYRGEWLHVLGKRDKPRSVPFAEMYRKVIDLWLAARTAAGVSTTTLFCLTPSGKAIQEDAVSAALERARQHTQVAPCTAHDLRRSFATNLLEGGADLALVKTLMGHESVETTTIYDKRGTAALERAVTNIVDPAWDGVW